MWPRDCAQKSIPWKYQTAVIFSSEWYLVWPLKYSSIFHSSFQTVANQDVQKGWGRLLGGSGKPSIKSMTHVTRQVKGWEKAGKEQVASHLGASLVVAEAALPCSFHFSSFKYRKISTAGTTEYLVIGNPAHGRGLELNDLWLIFVYFFCRASPVLIHSFCMYLAHLKGRFLDWAMML